MLGWQLPADEVPGRFSTKNIDNMSELSEIKGGGHFQMSRLFVYRRSQRKISPLFTDIDLKLVL